ncbi:hypothetical protein HOY80DRAFT_883424 [Tuber brumale]|nr:hypothetical protein HOY80DRAFT_883424 [Tuber brumale]
MLVRSPLAAYSFNTGRGTYGIRVCYQDRKGDIEQSSYDHNSGWTAGGHGSPGNAILNNGIAITGWDNGQQRCHRFDEAGWIDGELNNRFTAAHYSQLAALSFYDDEHILYIRVYYQDEDNVIHELSRDGAGDWYDSYRFPAAMPGTSIACSQITGRPFDRWLFYQKPDTTFIEHYKQSLVDWNEAEPQFTSDRIYDPGTYIACASYNTDDHRVFTIDNQNQLCVTSFNTGDISWSETKTITDSITSSPAAAIPVANSAAAVRIYFQSNGGQITEWGADDGDNYEVKKDSIPTE